jgi:hypothetical protein
LGAERFCTILRRVLFLPIRFVAYIDESGDTGLENVKTIGSPSGATEWLVLSCFLVTMENDHKCLGWLREIKAKFKNVNSEFLHFKDLIPAKKKIACETINTKACRYFIVASNKRNIEGHRNDAAELVSGKGSAWLYWWLTRLLLERVTSFCEDRVSPGDRGLAKIQFVFSRRGGLRYIDFRNYLKRLHKQSILGRLHIGAGDLSWSVVDEDEILVLDSKQRAGLQLSDLCAGAFFQALELKSNFDPQYAKLFRPRMAFDKHRNVIEFGVKTMPDLRRMSLASEQREIFEFYGFDPNRW